MNHVGSFLLVECPTQVKATPSSLDSPLEEAGFEIPVPGSVKLPPDDPEQSKRFITAAREIGADENAEAFERVFEKVVRRSHSDLRWEAVIHSPP
jgi:hypothetical protein